MDDNIRRAATNINVVVVTRFAEVGVGLLKRYMICLLPGDGDLYHAPGTFVGHRV